MRYHIALLLTLFATSLPATSVEAQVLDRDTLELRGGEIDTKLKTEEAASPAVWRRPLPRREGSATILSREAYRYFGSPITFELLLEEASLGYPLILGEEGYGRESFLFTGRTSEPLVSSRINGVLPANDLLTGAPMLNFFPMDAFRNYTIEHGARGGFQSGSDAASSDLIDLTIERFRTPLPYSRVHYTQVLARDLANFDGIFAVNPSTSTNVALGIGRRSAGRRAERSDLRFNPRVDLWSVRGQYTYESFLGTIKQDSTTTERVIDSILSLPSSRRQSLDVLVWTNYVTSFMGMNGGIAPTDSSDIFDRQLATTYYPFTYDHRVRLDGLAQIEMPLIADDRTRISLYGTYTARRLFEPDSATPQYASPYGEAQRFGAALEQPLALRIGSFLTRAVILGEAQLFRKDIIGPEITSVSDTRLMASISDSIAIEGPLGLSVFGFFRATQSNLTVGAADVESILFPSIGLSSSINIADWISFTASYAYSKDWALASPTPTVQYQLRNISGFFDARIGFGARDSIALHAGIMDRNEPEGIVYTFLTDTTLTPVFSDQNIHSQSANISLDWFFSYFRLSSSLTYFPATLPVSRFTNDASANVPLKLRFFGSAGLYYENEVAEGNLRISLGARLRFLNRLDPVWTYDPFADYYVFRGAATTVSGNRKLDPRIEQPKGVIDILMSTEVDRRAQVNMSFLNILSTPYYNVSIYPRPEFQWRIEVTWAFLD